jgi:hypothetical protein
MVKAINEVPWELKDEGFWTKTENLTSGLLYERYPCQPVANGAIDTDTSPDLNYFDEENQEASSSGVDVSLEPNKKNICAGTLNLYSIGITWVGEDEQRGLEKGIGDTTQQGYFKDNGFLVINVAYPYPSEEPNVINERKYYTGAFLMKLSGSEEQCGGSNGCPM